VLVLNNLNDTEIEIDIAEFSNGIYLIHLIDNQERHYTRRIIKN